MRVNPVFRWIWRINAVLIAIGGLLAIGALLFVGYHILKEIMTPYRAHEVANVEGNAEIQEKLTYGYAEKIVGSDIAKIPLNSNQTYSYGISSSKEAYSTRNLLFVNLRTGAASWLLPDVRSLIIEHSYLPKPRDCCGDAPPPVTAYYRIVSADTNGDGRLSDDDKQSFAVSNLDGTGYKEIFENVDSVVTTLFQEPDQLVVVYESAGQIHFATIQLSDFAVLRNQVLALPGAKG